MPGSNADNTYDLGLVGSENIKEAHFTLLNSNPVDVKLLNIGTHIQSGSVNLVGCASDNYSNDIHFPPFNMSKCVSKLSIFFIVDCFCIPVNQRETVCFFF